MVNEEIVNKICVSRGMKKMSISTNPTWLDELKKEGIELVGGKLKPFWVIDNLRDYIEPTGEKILKTIKLIEVEDISIQDAKPEKPEEPKQEEPVKSIPSERESAVLELPDVLTPALMTKWAKMTTTDRILLFQKTPEDKIKSVIVGKENGKDVFASYVEGNYMFKEANAAFLFDWYLDNRQITVSITGVSVTGTLYAWFKEYNKYLSRPATGYQEINKKVDVELAKKGATTDAIKKALSMFGFNSDVYSGEV